MCCSSLLLWHAKKNSCADSRRTLGAVLRRENYSLMHVLRYSSEFSLVVCSEMT